MIKTLSESSIRGVYKTNMVHFSTVAIEGRNQCVGRAGKNTQYCVCNSTNCDDLAPLTKQPVGAVLSYQTSQSGDRFKEIKHQFTKTENSNDQADTVVLTVDRTKRHQKINGIGAAFTDAATINIGSLPEPMTKRLINDYFGPTGIEFSVARIPIASSDFSTHTYTYDDLQSPGMTEDDYELKHFALVQEDLDYKIPQIKLAKSVAQNGLKLFASPWVTPSWLNDKEFLQKNPDKHYHTWANYFVKFLDAYKQHGVEMWGLTMQNEPKSFSSMNFVDPKVERDFVKKHLGPALAKAGYGKDKLNLMLYDEGHELNPMVPYVDTSLDDPETAKYISGVAYHCYLPKNTDAVDQVHAKHPDQFMLLSECCQNFRKNTDPYTPASLGDWNQAKDYAHNVMNTLSHWVSGWVEWNLALDLYGHPNRDWKMADAPLLVDVPNKQYFKNPNFYVLGHFSKFITPDSVRVDLTASKIPGGEFGHIAFERPDKSVAIVVFNMANNPVDITVKDPQHGSFNAQLPANSIQSYVYWN
ncbi:unnamed protein product [Medioppia subpectinata]|uniref:Glucosylceramidase n=1 Tax=Medioppia subpectinata TaxID=1979941 RepID=A0A7R9PXH5_9ACAR|nr:unnamed protein product [Medioppia subpectinata]CAG2104823.1 unnamed protein product [Medioppia subpectinata]